jgi:hypothetical protein
MTHVFLRLAELPGIQHVLIDTVARPPVLHLSRAQSMAPTCVQVLAGCLFAFLPFIFLNSIHKGIGARGYIGDYEGKRNYFGPRLLTRLNPSRKRQLLRGTMSVK